MIVVRTKPEYARRGFDGRPGAGYRPYEDGYEHANVWLPAEPYTPTPETEPAAVWAAQVADVEKASRGRGWSIEGIAAVLVLPEWNVRRALHQLGRLPAGEWREKKPGAAAAGATRRPFSKCWPDVEAALKRAGKPLTTAEVADAAGLTVPRAWYVLPAARVRGLVHGEKRGTDAKNGAKYVYYWRLV